MDPLPTAAAPPDLNFITKPIHELRTDDLDSIPRTALITEAFESTGLQFHPYDPLAYDLPTDLYNPDSIKVKPMLVPAHIILPDRDIPAIALLDCGACAGSYMRRDFYEANKDLFLPYSHPWHGHVLLANGIDKEATDSYVLLTIVIVHNKIRYTAVIPFCLFPMTHLDTSSASLISLPA
jgi:hypothetical protein